MKDDKDKEANNKVLQSAISDGNLILADKPMKIWLPVCKIFEP